MSLLQDTLFNLVYTLLRKNNIKNIDKEELKLQISSHPSYPSLHAITGVLDHFGIENMALDIPQNKEVYSQLPNYFIAQLKNEDEEEHIILVDKKDTRVLINYSDKEKESLTSVDFLKQWTGVVVVVDELTTSVPIKNTNFLNYLPIILLASVLGYLFFNKTTVFSIFNVLHLTFSLVGVYISILLLKHELGINSETVEKLCTQTKKTSCDAVLNSKGANLFSLFKLSDLSFVYFSSLTIAWLFFNSNNDILFNSIKTLSLLAVPIIFYSVFYQAIIVKKWCPLCLATTGILLCQALVSYFVSPFNLLFDLNGFLILAVSFLSTIILYTNIKSIIKNKLNLDKTKVEYYKFKRKYSLFNSLYHNKPILKTSILNIQEIVFGNKNAKIQIVAITNPLCGYCKATHHALDNLLKNQFNDLKITIRFNINTENKDDLSYKISTALINLYKKDEIACREAMLQIYTNDVDINLWLKNYKSYTKKSQFETLESEKQWCLENNINFTPAVYLNNKEYPKEYELSDLSFFMEDLIEESLILSPQKEETEKQYEKL